MDFNPESTSRVQQEHTSNDRKKQLLVFGYIREIDIAKTISVDILNLCLSFYFNNKIIIVIEDKDLKDFMSSINETNSIKQTLQYNEDIAYTFIIRNEKNHILCSVSVNKRALNVADVHSYTYIKCVQTNTIYKGTNPTWCDRSECSISHSDCQKHSKLTFIAYVQILSKVRNFNFHKQLHSKQRRVIQHTWNINPLLCCNKKRDYCQNFGDYICSENYIDTNNDKYTFCLQYYWRKNWYKSSDVIGFKLILLGLPNNKTSINIQCLFELESNDKCIYYKRCVIKDLFGFKFGNMLDAWIRRDQYPTGVVLASSQFHKYEIPPLKWIQKSEISKLSYLRLKVRIRILNYHTVGRRYTCNFGRGMSND
eukprot:458065_1